MSSPPHAYLATLATFRRFCEAITVDRDPYEDARALGDVARALVTAAEDAPEFLIDTMARAHATLGQDPRRYEDLHAAGTATLSVLLGRALRLDRSSLYELACSGLLADVGAAVVQPEESEEPRALEPHERARLDAQLMRAVAALMIGGHRDSGFLTRLVVAYEHHRPFAELHPLSRIVAVACAGSALLLPRPWRPAMSVPQARATIAAEAGSRFDPTVALALEVILGTWTKLASAA